MSHEYPYTNLHELNLDWIISTIKRVEGEVDDFVAYNKITFAGTWDASKSYAAWNVVEDNSGNGYVSQKAVPPNVNLNDTDYWIPIASYNALYTAFDSRITTLENNYVPKSRTINGQNLSANRTIPASAVPYDNTGSSLSSTNVNAAIDEISNDFDALNSRIDSNIKIKRFALNPNTAYTWDFNAYTTCVAFLEGGSQDNLTMTLIRVTGIGAFNQADFPSANATNPVLLEPVASFQRGLTTNAYTSIMTFFIFLGDVNLHP